MATDKMAIADAVARYDATLAEVGGCSNHGCVMRPDVGGMRTNGICMCARDRHKAERALRAANILRLSLTDRGQ